MGMGCLLVRLWLLGFEEMVMMVLCLMMLVFVCRLRW